MCIRDRVKTEYFSDNSASLPGLGGAGGSVGPTGFEPGMFKKENSEPHLKSDLSSKVRLSYNNQNSLLVILYINLFWFLTSGL